MPQVLCFIGTPSGCWAHSAVIELDRFFQKSYLSIYILPKFEVQNIVTNDNKLFGVTCIDSE